jgi:hypothetical protein
MDRAGIEKQNKYALEGPGDVSHNVSLHRDGFKKHDHTLIGNLGIVNVDTQGLRTMSLFAKSSIGRLCAYFSRCGL